MCSWAGKRSGSIFSKNPETKSDVVITFLEYYFGKIKVTHKAIIIINKEIREPIINARGKEENQNNEDVNEVQLNMFMLCGN